MDWEFFSKDSKDQLIVRCQLCDKAISRAGKA